MRNYFLILMLLLATTTSFAQVQEAWVKQDVGDFFDDTDDPALVLDNNENIIVGLNTRVPDYDSEVFTDQLSTFHISKFRQDGTVVFEILAEVTSSTQKSLVDIAVDGSGNIYCAVHLWRVVDPVTPRLAGLFLVYKYEPDGDLVWARIYGDGENNFPRAIAVDGAGNVYLTGGSKESGLVQNNQLADYLTVKWNSSGAFQWAKRYDGASPGEGFNVAADIVVDGSGNVYITGFSQRDGVLSYATIKYNSTGAEQWVQRYTGTGPDNDIASAITRDINGFIYVTGSSEGAIATIKYNNDGAQLWVQRKGSGGANGRDVKVDAFGNVYVAGNSSQTQAALVKYRFDGVELWTATKPGTLHSMALDGGGNIYVSGTNNGKGLTEKYNSAGVSQWVKTNDSPGNPGVNKPIAVYIPNENVYVISFSWRNCSGCGTPRYVAQLIKYTQCTINISASIHINTEAGLCGATVSVEATTTGDCSTIEYQNSSGEIAYTPGQFLNAGHYHLKAVSKSTGEEASFTIYVDDNELPVITSCPSDKTVNTDPGVCYASAASVNAGTATATDNCTVTVTGTRSDGQILSANYPVGTTIITWVARDVMGNTATCSQTIMVEDNEPPVISGESAGTYILSPPDHTMRDVVINYAITDNCDVTSALSVTSNEPVNGMADGDTDPDWIVVDNHHVILRAERAANGDGRIYTVTITAEDPSGNISSKTIEINVPHDIRKPVSGNPFKVGSTVSFEGIFWDVPGNKHTAKWLIDGSTNVKGAVNEPVGNSNGKVTGSYKFNIPGVYKIQMNTTDQNGVTHFTTVNGDIEEIVVVYDPNGGYTYGGGYFNSLPGAFLSDPSATGKAGYGFAMNYFKNSTYPKGETQFEFKVGDFEFNALNFEYLAINNAFAQFKGTGKITGNQSGIEFIMTVIDGQLDASGIDKIRMKIYNKNTGEVIYDNQPGASDAALPVQAVGAHSEIVIKGTGSNPATTKTASETIEAEGRQLNGLEVKAYPNPAGAFFNIIIGSTDDERKILVQVFNQLGKIVEERQAVNGSIIRLGDHYSQGVYFVRVIQGNKHKEIKIIKLSE